MKREMRNYKRKLSGETAAEILENGLYGVLSTADENAVPYGVPLSYAAVGDVIYFHCAREGHKLDNIAANSNVCFTVVDGVETLAEKFSTKYRSVIAFGKIRFAQNDAEKMKGIEAIMMKYSSDYAEAGKKYIEKDFEKFNILVMDIADMSAKGRTE